ncbi:MAG: hypothetical protein ACYCOU_07310 [Sulfobacillus sp.]
MRRHDLEPMNRIAPPPKPIASRKPAWTDVLPRANQSARNTAQQQLRRVGKYLTLSASDSSDAQLVGEADKLSELAPQSDYGWESDFFDRFVRLCVERRVHVEPGEPAQSDDPAQLGVSGERWISVYADTDCRRGETYMECAVIGAWLTVPDPACEGAALRYRVSALLGDEWYISPSPSDLEGFVEVRQVPLGAFPMKRAPFSLA